MALDKKPAELIAEVTIKRELPATARSRKRASREKGPGRVGPVVELGSKKNSEPAPFSAEYLRLLKVHDPATEAHFDAYFRARLWMKLGGYRLQESDRRDVIQETLLRVVKAVQNDQVRSPEAFGGFVNGVCRNVLSEYWHPQDLSVDEIDLPDPTESAETRLLNEERKKQVETVLNGLKRKDRNLLRAKLFDELNSEEISVRFGVKSPSHLRLLLHRARKEFAKACKKAGLDFL
jgi:RNA polymerase sigma factor (sigma-70 family)